MTADNDKLHTEQDAKSVMQEPGTGRPTEGQGAGGHNFGSEGKPTPMGDDKDNPSQNAHYANAYFSRTAPLDEDTADNNFKAAGQQGKPDYDKAQANIPGPQEVPDQQKVGESNSQKPAYREPELDSAQPDHGANVSGGNDEIEK